jgi:hypothetical protein
VPYIKPRKTGDVVFPTSDINPEDALQILGFGQVMTRNPEIVAAF